MTHKECYPGLICEQIRLSFFSMAFLNRKGLFFSSCLERDCFMESEISGEAMILWQGVLGESWCLMVLDPDLFLAMSFTEGQKKL